VVSGLQDDDVVIGDVVDETVGSSILRDHAPVRMCECTLAACPGRGNRRLQVLGSFARRKLRVL
jgi:hypothetical protein